MDESRVNHQSSKLSLVDKNSENRKPVNPSRSDSVRALQGLSINFDIFETRLTPATCLDSIKIDEQLLTEY